ncbi:protein S-acyltransferase 21 [Physcomitrium patens]|uniref:S-acyltransferase n=2 Tax=Physcomitrium patens TaxID=3218 RepID=A0A2K1KJ03_PHYPA|nr:probable protein S-acyltransferase 20 [Physcomitrium patens]PNR53764.1 hypothetical protein PHYPA_007439 [Physcomitrium patens]|eukprot:XP_024377092.1 probable protein S-acyltransferase 20 [Physcomitrella patens]
MVRRHGWQLPAHTLQVAAITVFFLLAIAYYIFLAPFLWFNGSVIAAYAVYSPVAFAVFVLYIRCTAIDPADSGVNKNQQHRNHLLNDTSESSVGVVPGPSGIGSSLRPSNPPSVALSVKENEHKEVILEEGEVESHSLPRDCSYADLLGLVFGWIFAPDDCCSSSDLQQLAVENEILFCMLCNTEVRKFSKHCRSCDKCVDGFDHHCRWLNNCIGKKNYKTFVALMSLSLMLLIVQGVVGTAVFVRCFVDRRSIGEEITEKLGNGFTRAPFAAVVAVCTAVAWLACVPLGELFFFHLILIQKGITTYEYVVAMRAQPGGPPVDDEVTSSTTSSTIPDMSRSSSVGLHLSSSLGLQQHVGWCTPPRIFVEHQDEAIPHPASGVPSATVHPEQQTNPRNSKPGNVRISAWRLAKLNKAEAVQAAENARKVSSVLRRVAHSELNPSTESDGSRGSNSSRYSMISTESSIPVAPQRRCEDRKSSLSLSPYKSELPRIRTGREPDVLALWEKSLGVDSRNAGNQARTDMASTGLDSSSKSSFTARHPVNAASKLPAVFHPADPSGSRTNNVAVSNLTRPVGSTLSDGYDASAGETTDDMRRPGKGRMIFNRSTKHSPAGSKMGTNFGDRRASWFREDSAAARTIQFKGRGISTSVLSVHQSRRAPWSSPSSASDADLAHPEGGPSSSPNPSLSLQPSQRYASNSRLRSNPQTNVSTSIFFSSPLMPIGESRRQQQANNPPNSTSRSGIPDYPRAGRSSRSNPQVTILPQTSDSNERR